LVLLDCEGLPEDVRISIAHRLQENGSLFKALLAQLRIIQLLLNVLNRRVFVVVFALADD
jgi:hypothetical protein